MCNCYLRAVSDQHSTVFMALRGGRKGVTTTLPPECNADTKTLDFRSLVIGFHSLGPGHWVSVQSYGTRVAGIQCGPGPRFKSIVFTVSQSIYSHFMA